MRVRQLTVYLSGTLYMTALGEQELFPRDIVSTGGFAIRTTACDADQSYCLTTVADFEVCCPSSLTCIGGSNDRCCPTGPSVSQSQKEAWNIDEITITNTFYWPGNDCLSALQTSPKCADASWTLCGGTSGYFCCSIGTTCYGTVVNSVSAVGCLPAGEVLNASQTAIGTVLAGVTETLSAMSTKSSTSTVSTSTSGTPLTSGGGGGGQGLNEVQTAFTVLGTVVGMAALILSIYEYRKRRKRRHSESAGNTSGTLRSVRHNRLQQDNNSFNRGNDHIELDRTPVFSTPQPRTARNPRAAGREFQTRSPPEFPLGATPADIY